ncbi:MAG: cellobiose phosphorylase, partial [Candidatus Omnitrophica bacterium]|nr:cellobiose phosphorylase [Candidatus Omnitrophota bacterium]
RKLFGNSFLPHFDYGKGGRGWRDLWQDALTLLFTEEKDAKKLILKSFQGVRIDGSNATIITKKGDFIADRNQISRVWMDHGVWPYLTLKLYIHRTGDIKILEKNIPYFQDHQFRRGKEINQKGKHPDNYLRTNQNKIYHGSLLEHLLIQNVVQFFNVGRHNCTLLENADWNDGLDMAADKGESVTFSFMYAHNLLDLCSLLTRLKAVSSSVLLAKGLFTLFDSLKNPIDYNNYKARRALLDEYFAQQNNFSGDQKKVAIDDLISDLSRKANHSFNWLTKKEWLKEGFFNGYYDNHSRRVEGKFNNKVSLLLPSQVFPIFSEAATKDQIKSVWKSLKKHLIDKKLSGIRLNTDFGKNCLNLGRAFGFAYGDKENGAFFNHMSILLAYALYKRDFNEQGYEIFNSIYQMASSKTAKTYPIIPEYFNSDGRGLYLYLTGSASWYIYTLFEKVLGIEFVFGDLQISPRINSKNFTTSTISVTFNYCQKLLTITFHKSPKSKTSKTLSVTAITLNGKAIDLQNNKIILTRSEITKIPAKNLSIDINLI